MHNPAETFAARRESDFPTAPDDDEERIPHQGKSSKTNKNASSRAEKKSRSHSLDIQMTYAAKPAPGGGGPRGAAPPTAPASSSEARSRNSSWSLPREAALARSDGHCLANSLSWFSAVPEKTTPPASPPEIRSPPHSALALVSCSNLPASSPFRPKTSRHRIHFTTITEK